PISTTLWLVLEVNNNQNSTDWWTLVGGLNAENFGQVTSFKLLSVSFLAPAESLVDTLPPAEISARLVISVIVCQFASHERRVEVFTQDAVLLFVKREPTLQQFHFDNQFVEFHENYSLPCEVYYDILELFFKRAMVSCLYRSRSAKSTYRPTSSVGTGRLQFSRLPPVPC